MTDERKPPRRIKTATERDLEGIRARAERDQLRTPPSGVPTGEFDANDFTPVTDVLERIDDPVARDIVEVMWRHTANMELRAVQRLRETEAGRLAARVDDVETAITDIRGEHGANGKLGALKDRVDKSEARRWWVITFLVGTLVTVLAAAIGLGRWIGSVETDIETLKARASRRAPYSYPMPAEAPAKDTTP